MDIILQFEAWKSQLREGCERDGKLSAFNLLEDEVLLLFFERGVKPTPEALIWDGRESA
jgi:hypothetical protein